MWLNENCAVLKKPRLGLRRRQAVRPSLFATHLRRLALERWRGVRLLSVGQDLVNELTPYQAAPEHRPGRRHKPAAGGQTVERRAETRYDPQRFALERREPDRNQLVSGQYKLSIPLPAISPPPLTFDLGLDAFLQVKTAGGVAVAINPTLNVVFNDQNGSITLDAADTNLDIGFGLTLPNFQATMSLNGLLYTHAVDEGTHFDGHLIFGFDTGSITPNFSGGAHIDLGLTVSFVDPALNAPLNPVFKTDFVLDWSIDTQTNQFAVPQIALRISRLTSTASRTASWATSSRPCRRRPSRSSPSSTPSIRPCRS